MANVPVVASDVSEHKKTGQLRSLLAAIVDSSADAIIAYDLEGKILSWNRGAEKLFGYSAKEAIGRSLSILLPPERSGELTLNLQRIQRGEVIQRYETEGVRKNGELVPMAITISPIHDAEGILAGVSSIARDISEYRRTEAELRRAGAYNRSLIEASLDPLVAIAPNGTITDVNHAAEQVTGRSWQELIGTDFYVHFTDREKARGGLEQVFHQGFLQDYELEVRGAGGQITPVLYNASVYKDEHGKVAGVFAAARDISERKRAEAEIKALNAGLEARVAQRTAELVEANRELEAFSYSVSHDLRVPLRAIDGFATALCEDYAVNWDQDAKDLLQQVRAAARRMADIIDGLLALARASRNELRRTQVDLSALAQAVGEELQRASPGRAVEFSVPPGLLVNADPILLRTVLENLLDNAWKFTRKHPQARIEVGGVEQAGQRTYFVKDDGAGFDMAYAGKLFQAFQRLHAPAEFEGTGIGLATVQRIIFRHGGKVWAQGELEKGATFFFTLPGE